MLIKVFNGSNFYLFSFDAIIERIKNTTNAGMWRQVATRYTMKSSIFLVGFWWGLSIGMSMEIVLYIFFCSRIDWEKMCEQVSVLLFVVTAVYCDGSQKFTRFPPRLLSEPK